MQRFDVDDDLVELVWSLAKPKPFESLTFSSALRRVLLNDADHKSIKTKPSLDQLFKEATAMTASAPKKAPSPSAVEWVSGVPALNKVRGLTSWKAICDHLGVDPAGDSARRKLKVWVAINRPNWPAVPDPQ